MWLIKQQCSWDARPSTFAFSYNIRMNAKRSFFSCSLNLSQDQIEKFNGVLQRKEPPVVQVSRRILDAPDGIVLIFPVS